VQTVLGGHLIVQEGLGAAVAVVDVAAAAAVVVVGYSMHLH